MLIKKETPQENYGYWSRVLSKPFDSLEELRREEKKYEIAQKEKQEAELKAKQEAEARKADASKVEEAFKKLNEAKRAYNKKVTEAQKTYAEAVKKADQEFKAIVSESTKIKDAAEVEYSKALNDFIAKNPQGYHITLKDGDNVVSLSAENTLNSVARQQEKFYDEMLGSIQELFNIFR